MQTFSHTCLAVFVFREAKVEKNQAIFAGVQGGGMGISRTKLHTSFPQKVISGISGLFQLIISTSSSSSNLYLNTIKVK